MHDFSKMIANDILIRKLGESTLKWTTVMRLQALSESLQRMNSILWVSGKKGTEWAAARCCEQGLPDIFTNDSCYESGYA